jgi:hypothetical protein
MKETHLLAGWGRTGSFALLFLSLVVGLACSTQPETARTPAPHDAPAAAPQPVSTVADASSSMVEKSFGPIKAKLPAEWTEQTPSSSMRKAQYAVPKIAGDGEDGELAVFYFGPGQGGSVEANIERWIGQISQPDGSSSKDKAKTNKKQIGGMPVTLVDVSGTYSAGMMSNAPPRQGYRMLAAVAETTEGPWFFKLTGPEKTIAKWSSGFDQFIASLKQ